MSAKKKRYPTRVGWIGWNDGNRFHWKNRENGHQARVRVTDARDLTAEKAIAKCINQAWINTDWTAEKACKAICPQAYTARVVNGKVRVRRVKQ